MRARHSIVNRYSIVNRCAPLLGLVAVAPLLGGCPTAMTTDANLSDVAALTVVTDELVEVMTGAEQIAAFNASKVEGAAQPVTDVMQMKLQDAINTLLDGGAEEQTQLEAVDQVIESLFLSNLVVLPTAGVPEADVPVQMWEQGIQNAIDALGAHIEPIAPGTDNTKAAAWEARNFLQVFQEAHAVIAQQTAQCAPDNLRGQFCAPLLADDETGVDIDTVYPGFSRAIRSPFPINQTGGGEISEQVIVPGTIADGECSVVLKEIQGVRALLRPVLIPIWVEPWTARATIVGFRTVWVIEFIPAEYLKTITYCNANGTVNQDVQIVVVNERELLHFWSYLKKHVLIGP